MLTMSNLPLCLLVIISELSVALCEWLTYENLLLY